MKKLYSLFLLFTTLPLYAAPPVGLPNVPIPNNNQQSVEKIALGKRLFNDENFSGDGTISCANCHFISIAFTDGQATARGINNQTGTRNAPTLINVAYMKTLFHDGRENSLESQALIPFTSAIEHGLRDYTKIITRIKNDPIYTNEFFRAFNVSKDKINIEHVAKAIASYERTLISANSPFDQYFFKAQITALNQSEARGLRTFRRKGNCANCHEISWNTALFTDNRFYNIGVGLNEITPIFSDIIKNIEKEEDELSNLNLSDIQISSLGRYNVSKNIKDIGAFKTPTLRNIALTAPYMHDGSINTLDEVVEYYDKGGNKNPMLNPAIYPLHLTTQEKEDLVAFMKSLTSIKNLMRTSPAG